MLMLSADWSQIELRVLAHFSKDPRLCEAFRDKLDLHRRTASLLFSVEPEAVTKEQRDVGKTVNFATIYGQGATALGQILGVARKDAQRYIESTSSITAACGAGSIARSKAHQRGYVTTLLGTSPVHPRALVAHETATGPRASASPRTRRSRARRRICASWRCCRSISGLPAWRPGARMLLQVHDELVFEVPEAEVEAASALVRHVMERPYPLDVPLEVSIGVGSSWGDAK
jgi:DNA polymerase-1